MSEYYCHNCASYVLGFAKPNNISSLSGTSYQLDKFLKHTAPINGISLKDVHSIMDDPSYAAYKNYVINTAASGWIEQNDEGKINIVWYAGKKTGIKFRKGVFQAPTDGFKVVFPYDKSRIHGFPVLMPPKLTSVTCSRCGALIPFQS